MEAEALAQLPRQAWLSSGVRVALLRAMPSPAQACLVQWLEAGCSFPAQPDSALGWDVVAPDLCRVRTVLLEQALLPG